MSAINIHFKKKQLQGRRRVTLLYLSKKIDITDVTMLSKRVRPSPSLQIRTIL